MNDKPTIEVGKVPIITKFIYTLGVLPTSYLMSMTYQEQVTWLCNYIQQTLIPQINEDVEAIQELQNLYELLRTYVNDYFDNLDVQEEINEKLNKMVETGEFNEIVSTYINPYLSEFNSRLNNQDILIQSVVNNNPIPVSSMEEMTDTSKIYVLTTNGNWYYYNGTNWVSGGVYQSIVGQNSFFTNSKNILEDLTSPQFTYRGVTFRYENKTLYMNGTANNRIYLRLSSSFDYGAGPDNITYDGSLDYLVVGNKYQLTQNLINGVITYPSGAAEPAVSVRNSSNVSILPYKEKSVVLNDSANRVQYYIPTGASFTNVAVSFGIYEVNEDIPSIENTGYFNLGNTEIPALNTLLYNLSYKTFKSFSHTNLYKEYMNNTEETQTQNLITQGMCSDRQRYIWFTVFDRGNTSTIDDKLCYIKKYDIQTNEIVASSTDQTAHILGHANGMCFNSNDNCLYIASLDNNNTVYKVNANTLEYIESFIVPMDNIPQHFADIDYNPDIGRYICLISPYDNYHRGIAIYTPNWQLEKFIKFNRNGSVPYEITSSDSTAGGIFTDREFIHMILVNVHDGTETQYNWNAYIYTYDYNGNFISRIPINYEHEAECITMINNDIYVNYNTNNKKYVLIEKITPLLYSNKLKVNTKVGYNMN